MPIQDRRPHYSRFALLSVEVDQFRLRLLQGTDLQAFGLQVIDDITFNANTTKHEVQDIQLAWLLHGRRPGL